MSVSVGVDAWGGASRRRRVAVGRAAASRMQTHPGRDSVRTRGATAARRAASQVATRRVAGDAGDVTSGASARRKPTNRVEAAVGPPHLKEGRIRGESAAKPRCAGGGRACTSPPLEC